MKTLFHANAEVHLRNLKCIDCIYHSFETMRFDGKFKKKRMSGHVFTSIKGFQQTCKTSSTRQLVFCLSEKILFKQVAYVTAFTKEGLLDTSIFMTQKDHNQVCL